MSAFTEVYLQALTRNRLERYAPHAAKFEALAELLRTENKKYNLTAITDDRGIAYRHFADCLYAADRFEVGAQVLDVGCGGGFPVLPLAIVRPDLRLTALDSTAKKLGFVEQAAKRLALENVRVLCARAEEAGQGPWRERYDAVCARAVARLPLLLEWCIPLVKPDGVFYALKGKNGGKELAEAANALAALLCTAECEEYTLLAPEPQGRCLITVRKRAPTPARYPRPGGQAVKKPL